MPHPTLKKTVLFSDIVGSSKLYHELGNEKAEAHIRYLIHTLTSCANRFSGTVIKTIGDEIMCAFEDLFDATECASELNRLAQESKIELRTGISSGEMIERDADLFGDVVNNAAFLTKAARAREILIDEMALNSGSISPSRKVDLIAEMTMKGRSQPCKIYRLDWEQSLDFSLSATLVHNVNTTSISPPKTLHLQHQEKTFTIDISRPLFVIGRDKLHADLVIHHRKISRKHCSIEFRQGKFVFQDHSTNGSFILRHSGEITPVHREFFSLMGKGSITLGENKIDENFCVRFEIV